MVSQTKVETKSPLKFRTSKRKTREEMRVRQPTIEGILSAITNLIPPILYPSLRTILIKTLQLGPLPNHVGFIMDGNRRFSRQAGLPLEDGHRAGFEALKRVCV
jgi:ditrans,polycis-polyprenyl diphosphate synthase